MPVTITDNIRGRVDGRSANFKEIIFSYTADGSGSAGFFEIPSVSSGYIIAITLAPDNTTHVGTVVVEDDFSVDLVSGLCVDFNGRINFADNIPFNRGIKIIF